MGRKLTCFVNKQQSFRLLCLYAYFTANRTIHVVTNDFIIAKACLNTHELCDCTLYSTVVTTYYSGGFKTIPRIITIHFNTTSQTLAYVYYCNTTLACLF